MIFDFKQSNINIVYSTPSCYVQALKAANPGFAVKNDDFFPYASANQSYWTGYFTSRPAFKFFIRQSSALLQASDLIEPKIRSSC